MIPDYSIVGSAHVPACGALPHDPASPVRAYLKGFIRGHVSTLTLIFIVRA